MCNDKWNKVLIIYYIFSEGYGGFVDLGLGGQETSIRSNKGSQGSPWIEKMSRRW